MDLVRIDVTGDRQVGLRFDAFPDALYEDLKTEIDALATELYARIEAATPSRTGLLRSEERVRLFADPNRISGYVDIAGAKGSQDFAKAAALEYGAHGQAAGGHAAGDRRAAERRRSEARGGGQRVNIDFEPVMSALFASLEAAATLEFSALSMAGSPLLQRVSDLDGLFAGLPVFGPGLAKGATIAELDPDAGTVTLSAPSTSPCSGTFKTGFLTTGRRVQHWNQVAAQPALFLRRLGTTDEYQDGLFSQTTLECEAWIYSKAGADPDVTPDAALSALDQLVRQSFRPDADYGDPRFTLGGLVYWCRIEGRSDYSPGDQGGQGISRLPIRITLP